jgi:hypothetical protein
LSRSSSHGRTSTQKDTLVHLSMPNRLSTYDLSNNRNDIKRSSIRRFSVIRKILAVVGRYRKLVARPFFWFQQNSFTTFRADKLCSKRQQIVFLTVVITGRMGAEINGHESSINANFLIVKSRFTARTFSCQNAAPTIKTTSATANQGLTRATPK